jgi:rhodanese-related sulfurtransferase
MNNSLLWRFLVFNVTILTFTPIVNIASSTLQTESNQSSNIINNNSMKETTIDGYVNLTVAEVWDFISDSNNGIQILIDVRTPEEYFNERIYTSSFLEKPRLFPLYALENNELFLRFFIILYRDNEIILYCRSANRSFDATKILIDNDFTGTIYNMMGGINEWKQAGLPTI